jgi:RHS repeat-associated protein
VTGITIYAGTQYEEDVTNRTNPSPAYTGYYSFGGKLVGMRRGNQAGGVGNGQYRMTGHRRGSTSLVVGSTGSVVQRLYYKPYGEVAWSWSSTGGVNSSATSLTSVGYTGQRLDGESGLMYYGACFYDPSLGVFTSADNIAPEQDSPKTRSHYSYFDQSPMRSSRDLDKRALFGYALLKFPSVSSARLGFASDRATSRRPGVARTPRHGDQP